MEHETRQLDLFDGDDLIVAYIYPDGSGVSLSAAHMDCNVRISLSGEQAVNLARAILDGIAPTSSPTPTPANSQSPGQLSMID